MTICLQICKYAEVTAAEACSQALGYFGNRMCRSRLLMAVQEQPRGELLICWQGITTVACCYAWTAFAWGERGG